MGKTLVLMRHGQAETFAENDLRRKLTPRGRLDAASVGEALRPAVRPSAVLTSPAERARETARIVAGKLGRDPGRLLELPELYNAGPEEVVELLHGAFYGGDAILLTGHNPVLPEVAELLGGSVSSLRPAGALLLRFDCGSWEEVGRETFLDMVRFSPQYQYQ